MPYQPTAPRLEAKLSPPDKNGCRVFNGARHPDGYGHIRHEGKVRPAHVVAWEIANGRPVTAGTIVMHSCDNPPCCEPSHLVNGTKGDNNRDRAAKGRSADTRGMKHHGNKLTDDDVRSILSEWKSGATQVELAAKYGLRTHKTIGRIVNGEGWTHITR